MFANQYEEHLAHSAPCSSRWDGFDRGTDWADEQHVTERVIGRMTSESGHRVVILEQSDEGTIFHQVLVDGREVFFEQGNRAGAIAIGRWFMDGCPA